MQHTAVLQIHGAILNECTEDIITPEAIAHS